MVSLVDIGPSKGIVLLRGQEVDITGLTAIHVAGIFLLFPEIRRILNPQGDVPTDIIQSLLARFPLAVAMGIAAGCGHPEDKDYVAFAQTLTVGEQFLMLEGIFGITFPQSLPSFLDAVEGIMAKSAARGWVQDTKSPEQSSSASSTGDQNTTAGTAPPDNSVPGAS